VFSFALRSRKSSRAGSDGPPNRSVERALARDPACRVIRCAAVLLYISPPPSPPPPTRLSSSLSGIISARVPETGASASESFNEIDFTAGRTAGEGEPASEGIVLGMPDDVPLTVSHVLFLESSSPPLPASPPPRRM